MNFFKALLNINSLREQNKQLEERNLQLAENNLQLHAQTHAMRDQFVMQDSTIRSLKAQYDKVQAELNSLRGSAKQQTSAPKQPSNNQQPAKMSAPNHNHNKQKRGRKPKAVAQP